MKKFFLSLLTMISMVTMAMVMTACGGESESDEPEQNPALSRSVYLLGSPDEYDYINMEYLLKCGDQTVTLNLANMRPVKIQPVGEAESSLNEAAKFNMSYETFCYEVPATMKGEIKVFSNLSFKADAPQRDTYRTLHGAFYSEFFHGQGFFMGSLPKDKLEEYLSKRNAAGALTTFTLK